MIPPPSAVKNADKKTPSQSHSLFTANKKPLSAADAIPTYSTKSIKLIFFLKNGHFIMKSHKISLINF